MNSSSLSCLIIHPAANLWPPTSPPVFSITLSRSSFKFLLPSSLPQILAEIFSAKKRLDIRLKYAFSHEFELFVDPIRTKRVFSNLIANAVEAMNGSGQISFLTAKTTGSDGSSYVRIAITNSGSYIPPDQRATIFEAFYKRHEIASVKVFYLSATPNLPELRP